MESDQIGDSRAPRSWRLQDIVLLRGLCARINHPVSAPPTRIAHTIALLFYDYYAIYDPPPTALVYAIHHTIWVMVKMILSHGTPPPLT